MHALQTRASNRIVILSIMSEQYKFYDKSSLYFTTSTVVDWVDIFTRSDYKLIIIDSLKYCQQNKGLVIHSWCLMTNHLHMIISADEGFDLSEIMRDFKKFTSKEIIRTINNIKESRKGWMLARFEYAGKQLKRIKNYKIWQDGNHPIEVITNDIINQKLNYIHNNPVVAYIVEKPEEYLYSSARDYVGVRGLLDVILID